MLRTGNRPPVIPAKAGMTGGRLQGQFLAAYNFRSVERDAVDRDYKETSLSTNCQDAFIEAYTLTDIEARTFYMLNLLPKC